MSPSCLWSCLSHGPLFHSSVSFIDFVIWNIGLPKWAAPLLNKWGSALFPLFFGFHVFSWFSVMCLLLQKLLCSMCRWLYAANSTSRWWSRCRTLVGGCANTTSRWRNAATPRANWSSPGSSTDPTNTWAARNYKPCTRVLLLCR